jgi:AcrR family transcriptional regulator
MKSARDARVVTPTETPAARPPGRPRSGAADRAILDAALRLLAADGYARMTMDGVAAEAGVSKATIYLRYRSKADLATAALAHLRDAEQREPSGDLRRDLIEVLSRMRANAERVSVMGIVGTCLVEEQHTPELLRFFQERTLGPRRAAIAGLLADARDRGELAPDADLEAATTMLMGAYQARYLSGQPFPDRWEERLVATLVAGLAARRPDAAR